MRCVIERSWPTAGVLHLQYQIVLIFPEAQNISLLIHDYKKKNLAVSRFHLSDE
jgi:hypothetical protein